MPKNRDGSGSDLKPPSPRVMKAVNALLIGEVNTLKDAAAHVGMNPDSLSRALKKPHVAQAINQAVQVRLSTVGMVKAASVLETLLTGAKSEYVRMDSAKHILAVNGVKPTAQGSGQMNRGLVVQINFPPGFTSSPGVVIEHEPQPASVDRDKHDA